MTKFPSCNGEHSWWLLSNDKCLRSATARTLWKKGESSAPSVFHAFLGAICERALNLYVCRGGALWLAYHRTQTQSATQWECLFNPSTDIDSYYSYDTRTRQKCFIRTGYSFQPSIRLNSNTQHLFQPNVLTLFTASLETYWYKNSNYIFFQLLPSLCPICSHIFKTLNTINTTLWPYY